MSSHYDLHKEIFDHKCIDIVPIEKWKLVKWFNWENNENDQLKKIET